MKVKSRSSPSVQRIRMLAQRPISDNAPKEFPDNLGADRTLRIASFKKGNSDFIQHIGKRGIRA